MNLWAIYAIWRRHLTVYQATWISNFLPPLTEPIFYLFGFGLGLSPIVGKINYFGTAVPYLNFIAPGMVAVAVLFQSFFEAAYGGFVRLHFQKTWQAMLTAPINFIDLFFGELFWASTKGIVAGTITSLVIIAAGFAQWADFLLFLPLILLGSLLFAGMGLLTVGLITKIDHINLPIFLFIIPMSVMAGTYYPRSNLPDNIERIVSYLPLSILVDLFRSNLAQNGVWILSVGILLAWLLVVVSAAYKTNYRKLFV